MVSIFLIWLITYFCVILFWFAYIPTQIIFKGNGLMNDLDGVPLTIGDIVQIVNDYEHERSLFVVSELNTHFLRGYNKNPNGSTLNVPIPYNHALRVGRILLRPENKET